MSYCLYFSVIYLYNAAGTQLVLQSYIFFHTRPSQFLKILKKMLIKVIYSVVRRPVSIFGITFVV